MKTINYMGQEYELYKVYFTWRECTTVQEGILLHAVSDEFCDGDTLYGNEWTLDQINDESDLETLLNSGSDGTTHFHKAFDGTYHMDD